MDRSATTIYNVVRWILRLAGVPAFLYSSWVLMRGILDGLPFYQAVVWAGWALVSAVLLLWLAFLLLDRWYDRRPEALESKRMAKLLWGLHATKHTALTAFQLMELWVGGKVEDDLQSVAYANTKLRILKEAIRQDLLPAETVGPEVNKHARCAIKDAATFLQQMRWREVKLEDQP